MQLDGVEVPTLLSNPGGPVAPPIISGHGLDLVASDRPRRGDAGAAAQADRRHRGPQVRAGLSAPAHPADDRRRGHHAGDRDRGGPAHLHGDRCRRARRRGAGDREPRPAGLRRTVHRAQHGPAARPRRPRRAAGRAAAQRLSVAANDILARQDPNTDCGGYVASVLAVQHPAQITNYRSMGTTPLLLAAGLAAAAVVALGLALAASVRRCRRDLALLRVMGFVERQLAAAVAWHASITATIGVVIGVPLGIVLGRWLWTLFAERSERSRHRRSRCGRSWSPRSPPWCWRTSPPCCPGAAPRTPRPRWSSTTSSHAGCACSRAFRRSWSGWAAVPAGCRRSAS